MALDNTTLPSPLSPGFLLRLQMLAHSRHLLVGCDFDGTLAPLVERPSDAAPTPRVLAALRHLAVLPRTHITIISGRALADLRARFPPVRNSILAGSHGAEVDGDAPAEIPRAHVDALSHATRRAHELAAHFTGAHVEEKPRCLAVHFRAVAPHIADALTRRLFRLAGEFPQLQIRQGAMVIEFLAGRVNKGDALRSIRARTQSTGVFYAGDDLTDEDVFAVLSPHDMGLKVGDGPSGAAYRVSSPGEVASVLRILAYARREACKRSGATPQAKDLL